MTTIPSSLFLQTRWSFANTTDSSKFSRQQQVYRHRTPTVPFTNDPDNIDLGFPVVVTKNKVRGRGRALQITFQSESGKDFELIGWGIFFTKNTGV